MDSEVETGQLTEFWLFDPAAAAGAGALVELGELLDIPIPSGAADLIETSHRKTVGFKSFRAAPLRDGEEADLSMNWLPGSVSDALCRSAKAAGDSRAYKIVLKDGDGTWEITGNLMVRDYQRVDPMSDRRTGTLRVKWTSEPTEAAGA